MPESTEPQVTENPGQALAALWHELLSRLEDYGNQDASLLQKALELRRDVIGSLRTKETDPLLNWLQQLDSLGAWRKWQQAHSAPQVDFESLSHSCGQMAQRISEQPATPLLTDIAELLRSCRAALEIAGKRPPTPAHGFSAVANVEDRIDERLEKLKTSWVPARLLQFIEHLQELEVPWAASLNGAVRRTIAEHASDWRQTLQEALPELKGPVLDRVILLRALLEAFIVNSAAPATWSALLLLARDLAPPPTLAIELIRDVKQPPEWFAAIEEGEVPAAAVTRPGWAIRAAGKPWFCFPPAGQVVPRRKVRSLTLDAAEQALGIVKANEWLAPLVEPAQRLTAIAGTETCDGADEAARRFLDDIVQTIAATHQGTEAANSFRKLPKHHAHVLEQVLGHFRRWCGSFGLEVLPRSWSFAKRMQFGELLDDERQCGYFFRQDEERGSVYRVRCFGLRQGERLLRECAVSVSAGPPPAGLQPLEEVIKVAADHGEEVLLERLRGWREAAFQGTLDLVIVQFYVDFWGEMGEELRQQHPDLAQEFSMRLFDLLKLELKLYPFYPVAYQDHPDGWLQRVSGRAMISGRVRRVVRPGLLDEHGQLRVPALVEVE